MASWQPRLRLHFLPAYSPNLNVIERLWKILHEHTVNNVYTPTFKTFTEKILGFFNDTFPQKSALWVDRLTDNFTPRFGISRKTGYKIYDRYKNIGIEGLSDRSRRPYRQAGKLPFQIERSILALKKEYPYADREMVVTTCGRICLGRKKVNFSTVFSGQKIGITQTADKIWLVSFMHYDLGYFDLDACRVEPIENPFGPKLSPM